MDRIERARLKDVPRLSWLYSRETTGSELEAALAWPLNYPAFLGSYLSRQLYHRGYRSVMSFGPCARKASRLATLLVAGALLTLCLVSLVLFPPNYVLVAPAAAAGLLLLGAVFTAPVRRRARLSPRENVSFGREVYAASGLASAPEVEDEEIRDFVATIISVHTPPGAAVLAGAATDHQRTVLSGPGLRFEPTGPGSSSLRLLPAAAPQKEDEDAWQERAAARWAAGDLPEDSDDDPHHESSAVPRNAGGPATVDPSVQNLSIDIWSDIACPWCFIGKRRFEKALAAFPHRERVSVTWHSYQLDPSIPAHYDGSELDYLSRRKGLAPEQVEQMFAQVTAVAADEGLHYDFDSVVVANSFPGHELIHVAKARGKAGEVKEALLSAHFEQGLDIGSREVLLAVGTAAGLTGEEISEALDEGVYRSDVEADIAEASRLGIQGVPFFVLDGKYGVSGAQSTELFSQALHQAWQESGLVMVGAPAVGESPQAATGLNGEACGPEGC